MLFVNVPSAREVVAKLIDAGPDPECSSLSGPFSRRSPSSGSHGLMPRARTASAVLGPLLVLTLGLGFSFVPLILGASLGVQPTDTGVASAVLNSAQQVEERSD